MVRRFLDYAQRIVAKVWRVSLFTFAVSFIGWPLYGKRVIRNDDDIQEWGDWIAKPWAKEPRS